MKRNCESGFNYEIIEMTSKRSRGKKTIVKCEPVDIVPELAHCSHSAMHADTYTSISDHFNIQSLSEESQSTMTNQRKSYADRKSAEIDEWVKLRAQLVAVGRQVEAPVSFRCSVCREHVEHPIRCMDCSPFVIYCVDCEQRQHINLLHRPDVWKRALFVPYMMTRRFTRVEHQCEQCKFVNLELIDHKGRSHLGMVSICGSEPVAVGLLRYGFWPSSPTNATAAISVELLTMLNKLTLECAVSVKGFVNALQWVNNLTGAQAVHLYTLLIGETMSEFNIYIQHVCSSYFADEAVALHHSRCPACPKSTGTVTISLDGNFGLVRKKNSGSSYQKPYANGFYFIDADETDQFVQSYCSKDEKNDKECSSFVAGDSVRSHSRNAKLDIRGVFGSVCRHEFPILFADMKHGERLAYPVHLISSLREKFGSNVHMQIIYDIGCILSRHLKVHSGPLLENATLAVPVFHAYGHNASCQVTFSCRHQTGFGLTDGEGVERLWSFLRPLSAITKEMTPCHRTNLLHFALLHYAVKKTAGLGKWLDMRALRAECIAEEALKQLTEFLATHNASHQQASQWAVEYKSQLTKAKQDSTKSTGSSWESTYCDHLKNYYDLQGQLKVTCDSATVTSLARKIERLHQLLSETEVKRNITRWPQTHPTYRESVLSCEVQEKRKILENLFQHASERVFYKQLLPRYCDGQSIHRRLSGLLKRATNSVNKGLQLYNSKSFSFPTSALPQSLNFKQAENPADNIYSYVQLSAENSNDVPSTTKIKALQLLDIKERATEEKQRVADDMRTAAQNFNELHSVMSAAAANALDDSDLSERAFLLQKLLRLESFMTELWTIAVKHHVCNFPTQQFSSLLMDYISDLTDNDIAVNNDNEADFLDSDDATSDDEDE